MPSDTFRYIPVGQAPIPGTCSVCGFDLRGMIDFGITVEYFGAVLVCVECIKELANCEEAGLMLVSDADSLRKENTFLAIRDMHINTARESLKDGLVAVVDSFNRTVDDLDSSNVSLIKEPEPDSESLFNFLGKKQ